MTSYENPTFERQSEPISLPFNRLSYAESITSAVAFCPEIGTWEAEMKTAAYQLVEAYQPTSDFFDAPDNAIALIFASALVADTQNDVNSSEARTARKVRMADNFAWLTFGDYSTTRPHEDVREVSDLQPAERIALFRKYENPALSAELGQWMFQNQKLEQVRQSLGITREESRDFIPIVLRAGGNVHMKGIGESPGSPNMDQQIAEWKRRGKQFMDEQGSAADDTLPFAWVSTLEGEKYLCFPEPIAYALLKPDVVGFQDEGGTIDLLNAVVAHEYVHVQGGGKLIDPNSSTKSQRMGLLLHEYHAEVFSGHHFEYAYPEAYSLIKRILLASGVKIDDVLKQMKNGGGNDKATLYLTLANEIGLVPTAMLLGTMSKNHAQFQAPKAGRILAEDLGQYSVVDELTLTAGVEGVQRRYEQLGKALPADELTAYWKYWNERLQTLANS